MEYLIGKEVVKSTVEDGDGHKLGDIGYAVGCVEDKLYIVCWQEDLSLPVACLVSKVRETGVAIKVPITEKLEVMLESYQYMKDNGIHIEIYNLHEKVSSS